MSEQFYSDLLGSSTAKKRRKGQRMKPEQRRRAQAQFLTAYERCANVLAAAEEAEIDRSLVYYWQEHDEAFDLAFHLADKAANDRIEAEIKRRGMEGIEEPLVSNGMICYEWEPVLDDAGKQKYDSKGKPMYQRGRMLTTRKYSDTLLIFYAKKRMPEYRDKSSMDVNAMHTNAGDVQALQETIMSALAAHPEAKVAVAQALMEKARESKR